MYVTVREFAQEQGVSQTTVRNWIKQGLPTAVAANGQILIELDDGEDWLEELDEYDD